MTAQTEKTAQREGLGAFGDALSAYTGHEFLLARPDRAGEALDVAVLGVAPELPVIVGAQLPCIEPHRHLRRLAHLGAGSGREQRAGQRVKLMRAEPAAEDPFTARTDSRGQFVIAEAPAARADLTARKRGYAPSLVRGIRVASGSGADLGTLVPYPRLTASG